MKTAKEMFEELGYKYDDSNFCYLKTYVYPDRINTERLEFKKIMFTGKNVIVSNYMTDALCMNRKYFDCLLSVEELQAINKQVEELGMVR